MASAIATAVKTLIEGSLSGLSYGKTLANIAAVFILGLGVIAALSQVGIATTVTTPVLVAVLATLAGVLIVGVGGGLIKPMPARWESYLTKAEEEAPKVKEQVNNAPSVKEQATAAKETAQQAYSSAASPSGGRRDSSGQSVYDAQGYGSTRTTPAWDPDQR